MADLGATVDKLEDPNGGDYIRQMPPFKGEQSALFLGLNRNKRSVTLDLKAPGGADTLKKLVKQYDVLVESFRPGVMDKLGVGWEALKAENPRLIYCAISGYGQTGPDRLRAGHDLNYMARSGALGYGGEAGGVPGLPGVQVGDIGGGSLFALVGILAALHERQRTGAGRLVDVSMTDGAVAFLHMHLASRLAMGGEGAPLQRGAESLNGGYPCYGIYACADGKFLAVGALEPKFFQGVCEAIGHPELYEGAYEMGEGGKRVRAKLEAIFKERPRDQWMELFRTKDVCVEPVWEGDELLKDPQLRARGMFVEQDGVTHVATPLRFGPTPLRPPPQLGEHTKEILGQG
jgi:crotonobetainyl-CoA:carnitine CoA-transferase CaiB-like acyl-CoA transferase